MVFCDNFIYTKAVIGNESGYQITAKSEEVSEEIKRELGGYYYPVGIGSNQFIKSNTLLELQNNKIAFSMIKNIGIGFDGREDTLYNHTIILDKKEFELLNQDTRILTNYYVEDTKIRKLEKINIQEENIEPAWSDIEKIPRNIVESLYDQIFSKKKIAILGITDINLIPNIISFLPKSMRTIPFSTSVNQPEKQSKFRIIQLADNAELSSNTEYTKIDVTELSPFYKNDEDTVFEKSIKIFVEIIKNKNTKSLENIQKEFEDIDSSNDKNKLKIITFYEQIKNEKDKNKCEKLANNILKLLSNFDEETTIKYLLRIKEFLQEEDYKNYSKQLEIDHLINKFSNKPINYENIREMFNSLNDWNHESRDQIFSQLIKKDIKKIKENGTQLLLDARFKHEEVILDNFIQNKELHENILELFDEKTKLDTYYKKGYLEHIIERIAKKDNNLTIELLKKPVFNFDDDYDSRHYRNILKSILGNNEFLQKTESKLLLKLIKTVFTRIKKVVEYVPPSGSSGTTNSNLQELTKIIKGFKENLEDLEEKEIDSQKRMEISRQKEEVIDFLEKHKPRSGLSSLFD